MSGPRSTIVLGNEERDKALQEHFVKELGKLFSIKPVKRKRLSVLEGFHELIEVWVCRRRRYKGEDELAINHEAEKESNTKGHN